MFFFKFGQIGALGKLNPEGLEPLNIRKDWSVHDGDMGEPLRTYKGYFVQEQKNNCRAGSSHLHGIGAYAPLKHHSSATLSFSPSHIIYRR